MEQIVIGKFHIEKRLLPSKKDVCLAITIVNGQIKGEGGTFCIGDLENVISKFYNENF